MTDSSKPGAGTGSSASISQGWSDSPAFQEIPEPRHPKTQALYRHWLDHKPVEGLPSRGAFGFEAMHALGLMGHLFVIEPIEGGWDWRYRLLGSEIVWMFGNDVTNVPFREHMEPREAETCITLSNRVAQSGKPMFLFARFVSGDHSGTLETMSLPVRSPDGGSVWLIGCSVSGEPGPDA